MARPIHKLTAKQVSTLPKGSYGDGGGLWLMKRDKSQGSWVFRYTMHERPRSMGLGGIRDVPLVKARELRDRFAEMVTEGVDPQVDRKKRKREAVQALKSFQEVAEDAFESRKAELRGGGKVV